MSWPPGKWHGSWPEHTRPRWTWAAWGPLTRDIPVHGSIFVMGDLASWPRSRLLEASTCSSPPPLNIFSVQLVYLGWLRWPLRSLRSSECRWSSWWRHSQPTTEPSWWPWMWKWITKDSKNLHEGHDLEKKKDCLTWQPASYRFESRRPIVTWWHCAVIH